jgi:hypothetical protein
MPFGKHDWPIALSTELLYLPLRYSRCDSPILHPVTTQKTSEAWLPYLVAVVQR